ncbi:MAG TPA: phospholipase D-like domain-containing protein [Saliniramus sp.]|nr:phospholipase D-like domain-containing protein [Saliniramus sp.]
MTADPSRSILRPGHNCWRIEHADRLALIVDAADYFRAAKAAILEAEHSVYLIGWDFDARIKFEPEHKTLDGPNKLGPFLRWIGKTRPHVQVYVLKWDLGALHALGRGTTPLFVLDWFTSRRIHFKLDGAHPKAAAHHQKIIVVDDALAFCGGIDITADRWDTREHIDDDPRRLRPSGRRYEPWHDASTMVDGAVAGALGDLARERWRRASGDNLVPPPRRSPIWPEGITPTFTDLDVAIARTQPKQDEEAAVHEIESFYLDAIANAKDAIYWESQYFASRRIVEALAVRLREKDGPDIVVLNPESADGFLESVTMDTARARLLALIHEADHFGRFRIFTPVTKKRRPIYVHAKILIIDDRILRVGSSNINNRSMGFDTECDLIVEDSRNDANLRATITDIRNDLLGEHLGVDAARVAEAIDGQASFAKAIDSLLGNGRSLVPYVPDETNAVEEALAENDLFDPERPPSLMAKLRKGMGLGKSPWR